MSPLEWCPPFLKKLSTVESRFKKAWFKKESRCKKDCRYDRFFSTEVVSFRKDFLRPDVWFKKDFLRPNVRYKKDFFPKSGKNRDFFANLEQFLGFFQKKIQLLASCSKIQFKKKCLVLKPVGIMNRLPKWNTLIHY